MGKTATSNEPTRHVIESQEDLERISHLEHIAGDIELWGSSSRRADEQDLLYASLPALKTIDGEISIHSGNLRMHVRLPRLERATAIHAYGGYLATITAPNLEELTDCLNLAKVHVFERGIFPRLRKAGYIWLTSMHLFDDDSDLDLRSLEHGSIMIEESDLHSEMVFPALATAPEIQIEDTRGTERYEFPALRTAGKITIAGNEDAKRFLFPALVEVGEVAIKQNYKIEEIVLPCLDGADLEPWEASGVRIVGRTEYERR